MHDVTVCLTNWRRPALLVQLVQDILKQDLRAEVFLWNNGDEIDVDGVDWVVNSTRNMICWPRWFMAAHSNAEFVVVIDDDVRMKTSSVLTKALSVLCSSHFNTIVGIEGVNLIRGKNYQEADHVRICDDHRVKLVPCDIIKGKFMCFRAAALRQASIHLRPVFQREDDIIISAALSGAMPQRHLCAADIWPDVELINAPHSLWEQSGHFESRDMAAKFYFSNFMGGECGLD